MVTPAWTRGGLRVARAALTEVERVAVAAYALGIEGCGYLAGPEDDALFVDEAVELENLADKYHAVDPAAHPRTGRAYFKINALKFEKALADRAAGRRPIKVFFHSHLDCGAYFSREDAASMTGGGGSAPAYDLSYLVTAVDNGRVTDHKLFVWDAASRSFIQAAFSIES
jgi:proteasome lid subunit RPN8/RPN11